VSASTISGAATRDDGRAGDPADLRRLEARLAERFGDDAELMTSGNALRVLRELRRE
jgi:hypothetical protein